MHTTDNENVPASSSPHQYNKEEQFRLLVEGIKDYGIFLLTPEGYVNSWNMGAEQIKGYTAAEIIGSHFSRFYPQEAIDKGWPEYELKVARAEGRFEDEGWRLRKDGTRFWANVIITALYDANGDIWGYSKVTRDLTERKRHEELLRQSEERFRLLVEGVKDYSIFLLDTEGYISSWNMGAEQITGYKPAEIIGSHFSRFYPQEAIDRAWPQYELKMARAEGRFEDEGWRLRKDGTRFWANVIITALHNEAGELSGFSKVTRDLTSRKRIEALELAERQMTEFLAMLSHELRNPLAPIRNAVYMLQLKQIDDPEVKWSRDLIDRQVTQLTRLVDDLLEVSRVTSGTIKLQKETVDITSIISHAVESSRPLIDSRRHRLHLSMPGRTLSVNGDPTRLTQIVVNLLNNAAKYTPEGGDITLAVQEEGANVIVSIRDTGVGIAPEFLGKVFDLFTQGERTLDRSEGGLGIGLTLVRRLIEMHGGTVTARSEGIGEGSEFFIRLPLLAAAPSEEDPGIGAAETVSGSSGTRVLVVDDNADAATSMMMFLKIWGYDARIAHNGISALEIAEIYRPHIILLDIGLPLMNGYEVAERIRKMEGMEKVRLIALTGYGQDEDRRRAQDAGIDHHMVKPIDPMALQALLVSMQGTEGK